jgi:3-dehydroquinate dehydratase type I
MILYILFFFVIRYRLSILYFQNGVYSRPLTMWRFLTMQIAVITGPTMEIARNRTLLANNKKDGVEFRFDLFRQFDLDSAKELVTACHGKTIFTLRSRQNGGNFTGGESRRLQLIESLIALEPDYFDIEYNTDEAFTRELVRKFPHTKIISSYHNFERTPRDLDSVYAKMANDYSFAYKICTTANSLTDAYLMLRFIQKMRKINIPFIGICMGDQGKITRQGGLDAGNHLNYTILSQRDSCAPGLQFA